MAIFNNSAAISPGITTAMASVMAVLRRGYRSTCIQLLGDSTGDGRLVNSPATLVDEWPQVFTKRLAADYPAYTLLERKWNDTNQGYDAPIVQQTGTANSGAARCATFAGAGEMSYSGAAITGDIDIRVKVAPNSWTSGATLASRWESATSQRSWLFLLNGGSGTLGFNWSTAGTAGVGQVNSTVAVNTVSGVTNGQPYWVRVTFDVDNGASGNDAKFYTSPDGATWTQLGTTVTTATATSIFAGTAVYTIGAFSTGLTTPLNGSVYWVDIRPGLTSQQSVVPPLPDDWEYVTGETTVTFGGAPVLMFLNGSSSGQNVAYFDNATRRPIVNQPHGQNVIFLSSGHNDGLQSRQIWLTNYNTWITNIKALVPNVPIVAFAQNPTGVGGSFNITQQGVELRATRGSQVQQLAASLAGVYSFDAWPAMTAADTIDQLHPTTGAGSGAEKWGNYAYSRIGK